MKDSWIFGAKFREYLKLNFKIVRKDYINVSIMTFITVFAGWMAIPAGFWLIKGYIKLYSQSLYQKEAYLYQSVPVSSFDTVTAKMVVGMIGMLIVVTGLLANSFLVQQFNLPQVFMYNRFDLGITNITMYIIGAVLINGVIFFSVSAGNRMRESRDKKPKLWTVTAVACVFAALIYAAVWMIRQISFLEDSMKDGILIGLMAFGTIVMFWLNIRAMEKWYSV